MTEKESELPTKPSRRCRLKDERAALKARLDELLSSERGTGRSAETKGEIAKFEKRIGAIDEKLDRIELARELERQQDA